MAAGSARAASPQQQQHSSHSSVSSLASCACVGQHRSRGPPRQGLLSIQHSSSSSVSRAGCSDPGQDSIARAAGRQAGQQRSCTAS
jgi:hypothetical protein